MPAERAEALAGALLADSAVLPIGLGARDSLRLEAGLCLYGHDIDTTTTPVEGALEWSIQKSRRTGGARAGGFAGADRILPQLENGASRRRVGLRPEGRTPVREGAQLFADASSSESIGNVTSGGFGPSLNAPVAMGYLPISHATTGAIVFAEVRGQRLPVQVVADAFRSQHLQTSVTPEDFSMTTLFTADHEWLRIEGDVATIGVTDYAQSQLGDVVFVELPKVGRSLKKAEAAAVVESVKAASDVYAPISGEVLEVNDALTAEPALINSDAGGKAWLFKLKIADRSELDGLMDEAAYTKHTA